MLRWNPKSEIRNPKQIRNPNFQNQKYVLVILILVIPDSFEFRYSIFGFLFLSVFC
jgi:hypothetical protein